MFASSPAGAIPCANGDYWVSLDCVPCQPCPQCDPSMTQENEPCPNYPDLYNGGCVSGASYTLPIACGEQICGTSEANGMYNDLDVYEINLTGYDSLAWCVYANFAPVITIIHPISSGCGPTILYGSTSGSRCDTTSVGACLPPGRYWLTVQSYLSVNCNLDQYIAEARCYPCNPCVVCPAGGIPENEPCPDFNGNYNQGCTNFGMTSFPVHCGDTICGTALHLDLPDPDFYEITLTTIDSIVWCVTADFPFMAAIYTPAPTCPSMLVHATGSASACSTLCLSACLNPGTYWLLVAPTTFTGYVCKPYVANVQCYPCTVPQDTCDFVSHDFEPTNDACQTTTSSFDCPDTLCGRIETGAGAPDRDWYNIVIPPPGCRTFAVNCYADATPGWQPYGQGLNPRISLWANDCATLLNFDDSSGIGDDAFFISPCLQPGTYKLMVQGVAGSIGPYVLTMRCFDCPCPCQVSCGSFPLDGEVCPNVTGPDTYNGGCTSGLTPPAFSPFACGQRLCATSFAMGGIVDHDWYTLTLTASRRIYWYVTGEFPFQMQIYRPVPDCDSLVTLRNLTGNACQTRLAFIQCLAPGTYYLHVAPTVTNSLPCSKYTTRLTCGFCFIIHVVVGPIIAASLDLPITWQRDETDPVYHIYRVPDFETQPNPDYMIGTTTDTTFIDRNALANPATRMFYYVTMEDPPEEP